MRLFWKAVVAVTIGGLWPASASAFGNKHGRCAGSAGVTTVSVPATVTTTRTTVTSVPMVVTGGSSFVTGSSFSLAPNVVSVVPNTVHFGAPASVASVANTGDLATLNQSIQTLNATMTTTNTLLAKLVGGTGAPAPGTAPSPNPPFGSPFPPSGISDTGSGVAVPPYQRYEAAVDQALNTNPRDVPLAELLYKRNIDLQKRTVDDWNAANKRMADKIKAAGGQIP
jgi:hypothetical protein